MINGESNKSVQGDDMTLTTPGMAIETRETAMASRMFALGGCIGAGRKTRVSNSEVFTRLATVCNPLETRHGTACCNYSKGLYRQDAQTHRSKLSSLKQPIKQREALDLACDSSWRGWSRRGLY